MPALLFCFVLWIVGFTLGKEGNPLEIYQVLNVSSDPSVLYSIETLDATTFLPTMWPFLSSPTSST